MVEERRSRKESLVKAQSKERWGGGGRWGKERSVFLGFDVFVGLVDFFTFTLVETRIRRD